MKRIPLTKGLFALVDDTDYEEVNKHKWYASGKRGEEYAARKMKDHEPRPRKLLYMHRWLICGYGEDLLHIDHDDRNRLNNQRANIALTTGSENMQNTVLCQAQTGIGKDLTHGTYKAYYNKHSTTGTKRINIGTFKTRVEAIEARQAYIDTLKREDA